MIRGKTNRQRLEALKIERGDLDTEIADALDELSAARERIMLLEHNCARALELKAGAEAQFNLVLGELHRKEAQLREVLKWT